MIVVENVSRTFGEGASAVHAVREVTVTIESGSFVTIMGASGSGKSSLLNVIGTLDRPDRGRVTVDGVDLYALNDAARTRFRRDRIGFVFQSFNLLPTLNALENAMLPAELAGRGGNAVRARAEALLSRMGLSARLDHKPDELSGGEMQRVAIARALMMDPPILLADEPTGNLDSSTGKDIVDLLRGAVEERRTIVLVTHDPAVAERGDRVLTMADGRLVGDERRVAVGASDTAPSASAHS
jgi:putative ABC transport system ATP-binding protein